MLVDVRLGWRCVALAAVCSLGSAALPATAQSRSLPGGEVLEQARARQLEELHRRIGRFISGEAVVYRGELGLVERRKGRSPRRLPRGPVVAALVPQEARPGEAGIGTTLNLVSPGHDLWVLLRQSAQQPGVTRSSLLRSTRSTASPAVSCRGCLADLAAQPKVLEFHGFAAGGRLGVEPGTPVRIEISGRLERVEPADLDLADLEVLSPGFEAVLEGEDRPFERQGHEGILRVEDEIRELAETPADAPPLTRCERVTRYSAERFVDLADPSRFGVRDLRVLGARTCCLDHGGHGGGETCGEEASR